MSKVTGPLFKWFGSKWLSSKKLPLPKHNTIVEPYAGGAGYSLRHHEGRKVVLAERDPHLRVLWRWLIDEATHANISAIPLNVREGTDIRTLGLSLGQATLLKSWQRTNNVGDCWTISPWGNKPGQWTANTRARVADEFHVVRGWTLLPDAVAAFYRSGNPDTTFFIDPCYQYNYQYRGAPTDYKALAKRVLSRKGQVIVCEAVCPKTGAIPDWLPFTYWGSRVTSRRKATNNHHSKELLFCRG